MAFEPKIRVLVTDDSALMRKYIMNILESDSEIEVVGTAMNGKFALTKLAALKPDVMTLDIEMPEMNGLEFLEAKRNLGDPTPVIVLSSLTSAGSTTTIKALELGARDYILKPSGAISLDIEKVAEEIRLKVKNWARKAAMLDRPRTSFAGITGVRPVIPPAESVKTGIGSTAQKGASQVKPEKPAEAVITRPTLLKPTGTVRFMTVGISTGGPEALRKMLPLLTTKVPIVIVQHMPEGFTRDFAESLNRLLKQYRVSEAEDGDVLEQGHIYIAPGNRQLGIEKRGGRQVIFLKDDPPVNNHRPSVDYLHSSLLHNHVENDFISVIMTGMGKDGAYYLKKLYDRGVFTVAQDEETSIVYGMPRVALEMGAVDRVLSLFDIPVFLNENAD